MFELALSMRCQRVLE